MRWMIPLPFLLCVSVLVAPQAALSKQSDPLIPSVILLKPEANFEIDRFAQDLETKLGVQLEEYRTLFLGWLRLELTTPEGNRLDRPQTRVLLQQIADFTMVQQTSPERLYRPLSTPNDPYYEDMWHLEDLGMETAWDITTGEISQRVGVVDTGLVRTHEDLITKDLTGYDFISDRNQAKDGDGRDADYQDEGDGGNCWGMQMEDSWHGTHVAGTILAATNNNKGLAGMNWNAQLITGRAMGKCGGTLTDIMEAASWMAGGEINGVPNIGENKVSVLNMSLGGEGGCSWYEQEVVNWINETGVMVVAASGNDGSAVNSPANCNGVITVAAHDPYGTLTDYSSFDSSVEVIAPGGEIRNAMREGVLSAVGPDDNDYLWSQGTSMAAPHVTGAISLFQAIQPDINRYEVIEVMRTTGRSCANCQGRKSLNVSAALTLLEAGELPTFEDDQYANNQTPENAVSISCDSSLALKMVPGDEDWFVLENHQGQMVQVDVLASDIDQDLDLYASTGAVQNSNLTQSTSPNGEESVRLVHDGGPLYFVVMPYEAARGDYELSVTCTEFLDEFEPNNSIEQAGFLDCNTSTTQFMAQGERDWFALPLEENEPYSFNIQADGQIDLDLYITTSASETDIVEQSTTPTGVEGVQAQGLQYQLYAVVVPFRDATGFYTLDFQCPDREVPVPEESVDEKEDNLNLETTQVKTQSVAGCGCHAAPKTNWNGGLFGLLLLAGSRLLRRRKQ